MNPSAVSPLLESQVPASTPQTDKPKRPSKEGDKTYVTVRQLLLTLNSSIETAMQAPLPWKWKAGSISLKAAPGVLGGGLYYLLEQLREKESFQVSYRYYDSATCHVYSEGNYRIAPGINPSQIFMLFLAYTAFIATFCLFISKRCGNVIDIPLKNAITSEHVKLYYELYKKYQGRLDEIYIEKGDIAKFAMLYPEILKYETCTQPELVDKNGENKNPAESPAATDEETIDQDEHSIEETGKEESIEVVAAEDGTKFPKTEEILQAAADKLKEGLKGQQGQ